MDATLPAACQEISQLKKLPNWESKTHAGIVIPCHYEMFEFNTVSPEGFTKSAKQIGQKYQLLNCGERLDL